MTESHAFTIELLKLLLSPQIVWAGVILYVFYEIKPLFSALFRSKYGYKPK